MELSLVASLIAAREMVEDRVPEEEKNPYSL
jgi:hypothetical protein